MTFSNNSASMTLKQLSLVVALISAMLSACSEKDKPTAKDSNGSSFIIDFDKSKVTELRETSERDSQQKAFQKIMTIQICLKDVAETKTISKADFKISAGEISFNKTTNSLGCLIWQELLEYNSFSNDQIVYMKRTITPVDKHIGQVDFEISLNPSKGTESVVLTLLDGGVSQSDDGSIQYKSGKLSQKSKDSKDVDVRVVLATSNKVMDQIKERQTVISPVVLNFKGIDYQDLGVDSKLNLIFPYSYVTEFSISLTKQGLSDVVDEKIKRGNFLFHLAFVSPKMSAKKINTNDIYSSIEFKGRPRGDGGVITEPVTVYFDNLPAMAARQKVLLSITSMDNPSLFGEQMYEGVVNSISANQKLEIAFNPSDISARSVFEAEKVNKDKVAKDIQSQIGDILNNEGYWLVPEDRVVFRGTKISEDIRNLSDLIRAIDQKQNIGMIDLQALCKVVFNKSGDATIDSLYKNCIAHPKTDLKYSVEDFAQKINKVTDVRLFPSEKLTLLSKMNINTIIDTNMGAEGELGLEIDKNQNKDKEEGGKPGGLLSMIIPQKFKYGVSGKVYVGGKYVTTNTRETNLSTQREEKLIAQQIVVGMDVLVKKCLIVQASDEILKSLENSSFSTKRYFCVNSVREDRVESYYLISYINVDESSVIADRFAQEVNPIRMMIRGNNMYSNFKELLDSKWIFEWAVMAGKKNDFSTFLSEEVPLMLSRKSNL